MVASKWRPCWPSRISNQKTRGPRWLCITHLITRQVWVNWPFGSQEKISILIFKMVAILDFQSEQFLATFDLKSPRYFQWSLSKLPFYKSPRWLLPSFKSTGLSIQKKEKINLQDGCHGGHLGFPIGTILAIFDLPVAPILPDKFRVNWPFGSGEEAKNRFSRRLPWLPSWVLGWKDFSYFWSTSHPNASYQVSSQ